MRLDLWEGGEFPVRSRKKASISWANSRRVRATTTTTATTTKGGGGGGGWMGTWAWRGRRILYKWAAAFSGAGCVVAKEGKKKKKRENVWGREEEEEDRGLHP